MTDDESRRLTVVAILSAVVFGIVQSIKKETFSTVAPEVGLKIAGDMGLIFVISFFLIYLSSLGLELNNNLGKFAFISSLKEFSYDAGVVMASIIIIFTITIWSGLKLALMYDLTPIFWAFFILGLSLAMPLGYRFGTRYSKVFRGE